MALAHGSVVRYKPLYQWLGLLLVGLQPCWADLSITSADAALGTVATAQSLDLSDSVSLFLGLPFLVIIGIKWRRYVQQNANSREQMTAVIEHLKDVIITINSRGIVQSSNPALTTLLGYELDELVGQNIALLVPEPFAALHDGFLERYNKTGERHIIGIGREVEVRHKDGQLIPFHLQISEYKVNNERFFVGALHDLREHLRAKEAEVSRESAEAASRAKSNFLANMSHEIRTPMNGVIGMLDVLIHTELSASQRQMTKVIRDSAHTQLAILNDILDFSKIEAGKLDLSVEPFMLNELVESVFILQDQFAADKKVDLKLFLEPQIPLLLTGDTLRLRQIITNLINNSIKFSSDMLHPGEVTVRIKTLRREAHNEWLEIAVTDNGIGMDQKTQAKLFAPFSQADGSTTKRFGGTGLGLVITRRLVEMMGGEIRVVSALNQGSTFYLQLPFVVVQPQPKLEASVIHAYPIMVIGPDCTLIEDVISQLRYAGGKVTRVRDIQNAPQQPPQEPSLWVWVIDERTGVDAAQLQAAVRYSHPADGTASYVQYLVICRGRRRKARRFAADVVQVDGNLMTQNNLMNAVALAVGKEAVEPIMGVKSDAETAGTVLTRSDALIEKRLILVAEDNITNQEVIRQQLSLVGYICDVVDDGRQAFSSWMSGDYALLLTDLHMPEMDGYQLTKAIRNHEQANQLPRMPIIALTANVLKGEADHCQSVGMDGYLSKPVSLVTLKSTLDRWLSPAIEPLPPAAIDETVQPDAPELPNTQTTALAVDLSVLQQLLSDDNPVMIAKFIGYYRQHSQATSDDIVAYATDNPPHMAAQAHKLKSAARTIGALVLGELCEGLEKAGKANDYSAIATLLPRFSAESHAVESYLDNWLATHQP